jgi:hypothetical protein
MESDSLDITLFITLNFLIVNDTACGLTSMVSWALSFARPLPSFGHQYLIQLRVRLQSSLIAAIVSKLSCWVEVWTQGSDPKV